MSLGGRVVQWTCNDSSNQEFERVDSFDGSFMLRNAATDMCMDLAGGSRDLAGDIVMWSCHGRANQRFRLYGAANDDSLALRFEHSGLCVDVAGASLDDGTRVLQWECNLLDHQRFRFVEPTTPTTPPTPAPSTPAPSTAPPVESPTATTFRNIMVINERVNENGFVHRFDEQLMQNVELAFTQTFPALINELSNGKIQFENSVVRNPQTVFIPTRTSEGDCGVWAPDVPNWGSLVGPTGTFDVAYIQNPQTCWMWAAGNGGFTNEVDGVHVGVSTVSRRTDLDLYQDALAGWTHEFLHVVGEAFYRDMMNVAEVPCVHCAETYGYNRFSGPDRYRDWQQWYADYLNDSVGFDNEGLGPTALDKGTLRDYLRSQYQRRNLRGNHTSSNAGGPSETDVNDVAFAGEIVDANGPDHDHHMHPPPELLLKS